MRVIAGVPAGNVAFCKPAIRPYGKQEVKLRGKYLRVLMVSIGALENGPMAPDMRPMIICW